MGGRQLSEPSLEASGPARSSCFCLPCFMIRPSGGVHSRGNSFALQDSPDTTGQVLGPSGRQSRGFGVCFLLPHLLLCLLHLSDCLPRDLPFWKVGGTEAGRQAGGSASWHPNFSADPVLNANTDLPGLSDTLPASAWPRPRRACDFILLRPGMPGMPGQQQRQQQQLDCQLGAGEAPRALCWGTGPRTRG